MGISIQDSIATKQTAASEGGATVTAKEACDVMRDCVRGGANKIEVARALKAAGVSTDDISAAMSLKELYYDGASQKPNQGPVDLGNPQAAMNRYTQVDQNTGSRTKDEMSQNGCGAGCVVNASLLHGKEGILGLLDVMAKRNVGKSDTLIDDWRDKAKNNKLTLNDLRDMQAMVHDQMLTLKKDMGMNSGTKLVPMKVLEAYIKTDTATFGTTTPLVTNMKDARVLFVSTTDGFSDANKIEGSHFVLQFNIGKGSKVADTWPRQDGNQVADPGVYGNMTLGYIDTDYGSKIPK